MTQIKRVYRGGILDSNVYLIKTPDNNIIVDTPLKRNVDAFVKSLEKEVKLESVKFIIVTHAHFDHVHGLAAVKKKLPNARVIVHEKEANQLRSGDFLMPTGFFAFFFLIIADYLKAVFGLFKYDPVDPDIVIGDELDMSEHGIEGVKIIHTPGHSAGSVCILVGDEDAIVGDTLTGRWYGILLGYCSKMYVDESKMRTQAKKLLADGYKTFYPAHGNIIKKRSITIQSVCICIFVVTVIVMFCVMLFFWNTFSVFMAEVIIKSCEFGIFMLKVIIHNTDKNYRANNVKWIDSFVK